MTHPDTNPFRDGMCHDFIAKSDLPCGLDARKYSVKRKDVLELKTKFDGELVTWFCTYHRDQAIKKGYELTLLP